MQIAGHVKRVFSAFVNAYFCPYYDGSKVVPSLLKRFA
jgi:hypothetical protein